MVPVVRIDVRVIERAGTLRQLFLGQKTETSLPDQIPCALVVLPLHERIETEKPIDVPVQPLDDERIEQLGERLVRDVDQYIDVVHQVPDQVPLDRIPLADQLGRDVAHRQDPCTQYC